MGINRGSMYDTFGDKHALFVQSLQRYRETVTQQALDTLQSPGSPIENVRKLVRLWGEFSKQGNGYGCLMCNTVIELGPEGSDPGKTAQATLGRVQRAIRHTLERAKRAGELAKGRKPVDLADFLMATGHGLAVMSRAKASKARIEGAVKVALSVLE